MLTVEHIGIAVKNLEQSVGLFETLFNTPHYKVETVESEQVSTAFFKIGTTKIELLQATNPDSTIAKFIDKKGEGIHHIAYEVQNIEEEIKRLTKAGFQIINPTPKQGADNKMVCFLHPKTTNGVLIELCQTINTNP